MRPPFRREFFDLALPSPIQVAENTNARIAEFVFAIDRDFNRTKYGICVTATTRVHANLDRQDLSGQDLSAVCFDTHAFAHIAAHRHGNGIVVRCDRRGRAAIFEATAEIAMMRIGFLMALPRLVNVCGCCLAELYASTAKFIPCLFVSLLSP